MKHNRPIALLLALAMLFSLAVPAFAEPSEPEVTQTPEETQPEVVFETIYIEDAEDLLELAANCRLDTWSVGKQVILQEDISLDNVAFMPIPTFGGIFDGSGHTISGLHITGHESPAGLFGELQATGIIKDLTVSGTVAPGGDAQNVGGIVGENNGTITGCTFTGSVAASGDTGGIAGINGLTGSIIGCEAGGTVLGSDMTGGIAGCNLGIIGSSVNRAYVNTVSSDPSIDPEDISFDFLTDYSKLTSMDTGTAPMDTGGIAGYSSGIIESCTNSAAIGYPHIGYNVGGIAGRSCGYLHDCGNTADIYGRKDVGGITGQMEPYIAKNLTESALAKLQRQLEELDVLLDEAMEHADGVSDTVTRRLNSMAGSMGAAGNAAQDIRTSGTISSSVSGSGDASGEGGVTVTPVEGEKGGSVSVGDGSVSVEVGGSISGGVEGGGSTSSSSSLDAQTQIQVSTNLGGLASSIYGMSGQMRLLSGEMAGASDSLKADVELIRAKVEEITETGFELILGDGEGDVIIDSSELDIDLITLGKVSYCTNGGRIQGDLNVGGIAGDLGIEYALDPEDDVTVSIDGSTRRKYEVKAVIQHCENTGTVTAKRNYAGGIAGKMDLGLIAESESYGTVSSESGNYVGGIAGLGGSVIRHCFSKCSLSGGKYIGGIVGSGVEEDRNGESSTVAACYAIVTITDHKQYAGAISGADAGIFLENYFVSEELAGIDWKSISGCAEPISYAELSQSFSQPLSRSVVATPGEILPEEFQYFTLTFQADGRVIHSETFDYGASFDTDAFPQIPEKDGYYAYWDRTDLTELKNDTVVTAVYEPYITALASTDVRNGTKPILFVQGDFAKGDNLSAETMPLTCEELGWGERVLEQWRVEIPADGAGEHTVRYLPPNENTDRLSIRVLNGTRWETVDTSVIGSYLVFGAKGNDVQIAVVSTASTWWLWLIVGVLGVLLAALAVWLVRKFRKPKEAPEDIPEAEMLPEEAEAPAEKPKWWKLVPVVLALLVGIGGTAAFFLVPELMADLGAYGMLKEAAEQEKFSLELRVEASIGNEDCSFTATVERTTLDGEPVTVISENGRTLCYCDGTVFLENGEAYRIGTAALDYSRLLEKAMALYQHTDVKARDGVYSLTAEKSDAAAIAELLIPSGADALSDTIYLQTDLITEDRQLQIIEFSGSGRLNNGDRTSWAVKAELEVLDADPAAQIPDAVAEAITSGNYDAAQVLSDELYRLVNGWQKLNSADPMAAELTISADCGPLVLNNRSRLYRWAADGEPVFCLEENGYALYFTEDAICDSKGNAIPTAGAANIDAAKLLDVAYTACMNASAEHTVLDDRHTYALSLDSEGMEAVAYAIAPETEKLDISFESGSIRLVITGEQIDSVEIAVSGSVRIVLSGADVSIGAKLEFSRDSVEAAIPDAVLDALT